MTKEIEMKKLTVLGLMDYFSDKAFDNEFFVKAGETLQYAMGINFYNKKELSDWVNSKLDSDNFEIDQDTFIDDTNDIINVVAEFYNLD